MNLRAIFTAWFARTAGAEALYGELARTPYNALFYDDLDQYEAAIAYLSDHLRRHPGSAVALHNRAIARYETGDVAHALRDLAAAVLADPHGIDSLLQLGLIHERRGATDQAIAAFSSAQERAPRDARPVRCRAHTLLKAGRLDEALADLTTAQEMEPDRQTHLTRADVYERLGQPEAAASDRAVAERIR